MRAQEEVFSAETIANESTRDIYLVGPVTIEKVGDVIMGLRSLDSTRGPIRIVISSTGGDDGAGWALYDAMRICKNTIIVDAFGECMSIAMLILQGADLRCVSENCRLMIHNGSLAMEATVTQLRALSKEVEFLTQRYYEVLQERSGISLQQVRALCDRETFLSAQEALEIGFIDGIMVPKPFVPLTASIVKNKQKNKKKR